MICDTYPWLELADIHMVIALYLRNKKSVRNYLRESYRRADQGWEQSFAKDLLPRNHTKPISKAAQTTGLIKIAKFTCRREYYP